MYDRAGYLTRQGVGPAYAQTPAVSRCRGRRHGGLRRSSGGRARAAPSDLRRVRRAPAPLRHRAVDHGGCVAGTGLFRRYGTRTGQVPPGLPRDRRLRPLPADRRLSRRDHARAVDPQPFTPGAAEPRGLDRGRPGRAWRWRSRTPRASRAVGPTSTSGPAARRRGPCRRRAARAATPSMPLETMSSCSSTPSFGSADRRASVSCRVLRRTVCYRQSQPIPQSHPRSSDRIDHGISAHLEIRVCRCSVRPPSPSP